VTSILVEFDVRVSVHR